MLKPNSKNADYHLWVFSCLNNLETKIENLILGEMRSINGDKNAHFDINHQIIL